MSAWLYANIGTIAVLLLLAVIVIAIVIRLRSNKKSGKGCCGGDCGKCSGCGKGLK
jgi:hypothetical protein